MKKSLMKVVDSITDNYIKTKKNEPLN